MENKGRSYKYVPFYNINLIIEKDESFKNNSFVEWDSENNIFFCWLVCCFGSKEKRLDEYHVIQLVNSLFEDYMNRIVESYPHNRDRIIYFTLWINNTYDLLKEAASLYSKTYNCPDFEVVYKDILLFSKIEESYSDHKTYAIENHCLYRGLLNNIINLYVSSSPIDILFNEIDPSIILYNVWGERFNELYSYYSSLPIIVKQEGLAITDRSENKQWLRDIIIKQYQDYNAASNVLSTEELLQKFNRSNWLDSLCENFCFQKKVHDSLESRELILGWVVGTIDIAYNVYRDFIHKVNPTGFGKWAYSSPYDDYFFSFLLPELMRLLRNCIRQIISFYNEDPYIMPMEDHQNESESLSDEANEPINDNINYSETDVPTGYLHFTTSDEDIQKKIYDFLYDRIGKNPGYKEYLYLAALINLRLIKIPEYNELLPVYPMFEIKKYYPNFMNFFGDTGKYLPPYTPSVSKKIQKRVKEIHTFIPKIPLPSGMS